MTSNYVIQDVQIYMTVHKRFLFVGTYCDNSNINIKLAQTICPLDCIIILTPSFIIPSASPKVSFHAYAKISVL